MAFYAIRVAERQFGSGAGRGNRPLRRCRNEN